MLKKTLIFLLFFISCVRIEKDNSFYPQGDVTINIINQIHYEIMDYVNVNVEKDMIYDWDESKYGKLIEGKIDALDCYIFDNSNNLAFETEIVKNSPKIIEIDIDNTYNFLAVSKTSNSLYNIEENKFISRTNKLEKVKDFNFDEPLGRIEECEEQYSKIYKSIFSDVDFTNKDLFKVTKEKDGSLTYDYIIDSYLSPVTYVYLIQIVIQLDDNTPMNVSNCDYMCINGVAAGVDLFTYEPITEGGLIEIFDIKPFQHHEAYSVCCAKTITYGIPSSNSSWNSNFQCELGLEFLMVDGSIKKGKTNITKQILEKPYGGVVTIILRNSDVSKEVTPSEGFDIEIEIWDTYEFNLDF